MHVLFLHQNFPAQFGQVAVHLAQKHNYRCTFVSEKELRDSAEIQHVQFPTPGGATQLTHYCSRTFENQTWRSHAVYEALEKRPDIRPDLIVAHSGFVSSLYLRELYPDTPHINYFEFFYHTTASDLDFRYDLPAPDKLDLLRARTRNAQLLLDLHNCDAGYVPTEFQRAQIPLEYQNKLHTIFDGIDERFWRPVHKPQRKFGDLEIPAGTKVVTYVSRGFEAARGFDIFLRAATQICRERSDVIVVVVGEDRIAYGGDERFYGWQVVQGLDGREVPAGSIADPLYRSFAAVAVGAVIVAVRSAYLLNDSVCAQLVATECDELRCIAAGQRHGTGARVDSRWLQRAASQLL